MHTLHFDPASLAEIFREFDLCLVILFGSQVTGQTHAESDIDLGVHRKGNTWQGGKGWGGEFLELYARLSDRFPGTRLDLVDLQRVPGLLKHIACERGQVLFESEPGVFARFRLQAWNQYQDERIQIRRHDAEGIRNALESLTQ
jgi:predicted nucleotidyltransferase